MAPPPPMPYSSLSNMNERSELRTSGGGAASFANGSSNECFPGAAGSSYGGVEDNNVTAATMFIDSEAVINSRDMLIERPGCALIEYDEDEDDLSYDDYSSSYSTMYDEHRGIPVSSTTKWLLEETMKNTRDHLRETNFHQTTTTTSVYIEHNLPHEVVDDEEPQEEDDDHSEDVAPKKSPIHHQAPLFPIKAAPVTAIIRPIPKRATELFYEEANNSGIPMSDLHAAILHAHEWNRKWGTCNEQLPEHGYNHRADRKDDERSPADAFEQSPYYAYRAPTTVPETADETHTNSCSSVSSQSVTDNKELLADVEAIMTMDRACNPPPEDDDDDDDIEDFEMFLDPQRRNRKRHEHSYDDYEDDEDSRNSPLVTQANKRHARFVEVEDDREDENDLQDDDDDDEHTPILRLIRPIPIRVPRPSGLDLVGGIDHSMFRPPFFVGGMPRDPQTDLESGIHGSGGATEAKLETDRSTACVSPLTLYSGSGKGSKKNQEEFTADDLFERSSERCRPVEEVSARLHRQTSSLTASRHGSDNSEPQEETAAKSPNLLDSLDVGMALTAPISPEISTARDGLLRALASNAGNYDSEKFASCLEMLEKHYASTNVDVNEIQVSGSSKSKKSAIDVSCGLWLTLTKPTFFGCLGENESGDPMYTLGRMTFDMFSPTNLVCSLQGNFNSVEGVADASNLHAVPKSLRAEVEQQPDKLRTYNVVTAFTIEPPLADYPDAPNKDVLAPIRGIMTTYGYTLPDPSTPNRQSVWITGGRIEPNNAEKDLNAWKRLFTLHPPKHTMGQKAKLLAIKWLMGATTETCQEMNQDDGSLEYTFTRPLGGHGMAYIDTLYVDSSLRVVRGHRGTVFVFTRLPDKDKK